MACWSAAVVGRVKWLATDESNLFRITPCCISCFPGCEWKTASGHMAMPAASFAAGYASLASSANGKAGLRHCGTTTQQLFVKPAFRGNVQANLAASTLVFSELSQSGKLTPVQIFM